MIFARMVLPGLFLLAACASVDIPAPLDGPAWPRAVREFSSTHHAAAVADQFPNSAGMLRRKLAAAMEAGDAAATLDAVRRLAAMGAVLSANARERIAQVTGPESMAALAAPFAANAEPVAGSRNHATIPAGHNLVEGVIWDSNRRRLYVTTVVNRSLLEILPGGHALIDMRPDGVNVAAQTSGSLSGGAYDEVRDRIWIASASVEQTPKTEEPFVGLISYNPRDPGGIGRIPAPEGIEATPGDVAVARDGTVYASDGLNGALYRCLPGCAVLEAYLAPGTLFSSQGLAISPDQRLLYIADRRYGVAALERATGRLFQVTGDATMMLDGIDGLVSHGNALIGIQTAYQPARIIRMNLSPDGLRVERLDVLERAHPEWEEITLGTIVDGQFIYVANAQWEQFGESGAVRGERPPVPTRLRSIPLNR